MNANTGKISMTIRAAMTSRDLITQIEDLVRAAALSEPALRLAEGAAGEINIVGKVGHGSQDGPRETMIRITVEDKGRVQ